MLPFESIEILLQGVWNGEISVFELPTFLYAYTIEELDGSFWSGFGSIPRGDIRVIEKAVNFRQNISMFSGAKTFQEVNDLSKLVFDEKGQKRAFAQFKKEARKIDKDYNKNWLKTEQDTAFSQAQNSRKWLKAEGEKDLFPVLEYVTVGDDRVRPSHKALDGLKAKVTDPIWKRIYPANDWNCRCTVKQLREYDVSSKEDIRAKTKLIFQDFKESPEFDMNPGMKDYIFKPNGKGKASYFKVPRQFSEAQKENFGFPSVEEITQKYV